MSSLIDRDVYRSKMIEAMEDGYLDSDTVETMINILDCEPEVKGGSAAPEGKKIKTFVDDIIFGLERLGYDVNDLELRFVSSGRVQVIMRDEIIGIWDIARKTFVD